MICKNCSYGCEDNVANECLNEISAAIDYFNSSENCTSSGAAEIGAIKENIDILRDLLNNLVANKKRTSNKKSILRVSVLLDELLNIYHRKKRS